jgi:hypothetical protein
VVGRDVLEALVGHAARDELLGLLDCLNKLARGHAELLGAKALRRLCRGRQWRK